MLTTLYAVLAAATALDVLLFVLVPGFILGVLLVGRFVNKET